MKKMINYAEMRKAIEDKARQGFTQGLKLIPFKDMVLTESMGFLTLVSKNGENKDYDLAKESDLFTVACALGINPHAFVQYEETNYKSQVLNYLEQKVGKMVPFGRDSVMVYVTKGVLAYSLSTDPEPDYALISIRHDDDNDGDLESELNYEFYYHQLFLDTATRFK